MASETWEPVSPVTGQLDAFVWQAPPSALGVSPEPEPAEPRDAPVLAPAGPPLAITPAASKPAASKPGASEPLELKPVPAKPADLPLAEIKPGATGLGATGGTPAADPVSAGMAAAALPVPGAIPASGAVHRETTSRPVKLVP